MVGSITNLTRKGLSDWLWQRVSAILILAYVFFLTFYFIAHPNLQYYQWCRLFDSQFFKVATLVVGIAFFAHAWIGLWTVFTDYVKPVWLRLILQVLLVVSLSAYVIWLILVLWRVI